MSVWLLFRPGWALGAIDGEHSRLCVDPERYRAARAAVNIRQCEKAVEARATYQHPVEMGLQVVLQRQPEKGVIASRPAPTTGLGVVVFGSDQGMCGQRNEQIVTPAEHRRATGSTQYPISPATSDVYHEELLDIVAGCEALSEERRLV